MSGNSVISRVVSCVISRGHDTKAVRTEGAS